MGFFIGRKMKNGRITFGWDLCSSCNYRCPYCGIWEKKSEQDLMLSSEEWKNIWHKLYEKYGGIHIYLSGGEPSTYPYFFELVRGLSEEHTLEICTNLSWDIEELVPGIPASILKIAPTFHPTFAKFEEFFEKAVKIKEHLPNYQIYYVAHPGQIKDMPQRSRLFKEQGINLIPLPLRGDGFVLNSEEEKRIVEEVSPYRGNKIAYQLQKISPRGKACRAGQHYAVLRTNGSVDRCSQYSTGSVGSITDENFSLWDTPLLCEKDYCPIESQWIVEDE
jgi:MoaA/NifB/PqqE/SkfB family radical SAM enzyme